MKQQKRAATRPRSNAWYGWLPDLPDHRDIMYATVRRVPRKLPRSVDLRPGCSPVEDQGKLGSCSANASVGALEFLELKSKRPFVDFSRLFVYYNTRVIEGTAGYDSGAMIRDAVKAMVKQGVCAESDWPYVISRFTRKPGPQCYRQALKHQVTAYQRIAALDEMKACLADGYPFIFGFSVYDGFESDAVARTGRLNLPKPGEKLRGGHAVLAVGYDDAKRRFIVRNSWGSDWGLAGYFTIPYEYLEDRNLSDDFWTVRRGELM
jgi:C1A family cysteine protease